MLCPLQQIRQNITAPDQGFINSHVTKTYDGIDLTTTSTAINAFDLMTPSSSALAIPSLTFQNRLQDNRKICVDHSQDSTNIGDSIAKDLTELTQTQRENVFHDIHGVPVPYVEDKMKQQDLLQQFGQEIKEMLFCKTASSFAYERAMEKSPEYVQNESFRMMFLRAEEMNPKLAALRFIKFFEQKCDLFGDDKLVKTIAMDDLDDDNDIKLLQSGHLQLLKQKDQAGRIIFCHFVNNQSNYYFTPRNLLRVIFYLTMAAVQEEQAQKQGLVGVVYDMTSFNESAPIQFDAQTVIAASLLRSILPARYAAIHYCFNHKRFQNYIKYDRSALDRFSRSKCCLHQGSNVEIHYELQRYGIPSRDIPISAMENNIKVGSHLEWLGTQKFQELLGGDDEALPIASASSAVGESLFEIDDDTMMDILEPTPMRPSFIPETKGLSAPVSGNVTPPEGILSVLIPQQQQALLSGGQRSLPYNSNYGNVIAMNVAKLAAVAFANQCMLPTSTTSPVSLAPPSSSAITATKYDVLFGRGKVKNHFGNLHLHKLIASKHGRYEASERWEKTVIAEEIVSIVRELGGRFLKLNQDRHWEEVDSETAREKVAHTFRSRRQKESISQHHQHQSSISKRKNKSNIVEDDV